MFTGEMTQPDEMSLQKLEALSDELQQSTGELNSEFVKKHPILISKIKELNDITNDLEIMHKGTTVGSLVGSTIGAAGGVTALVGLGLSFITFGASLAVSAVGAVVGVVGGVTGAASNISNMILQKKLRGNIEKIINDFQSTIDPMIEHLSTISNTIDELQQEGQKYSVLNKAIMTSVRSVKTVSSITKLLTILQTANIGKTAAKAAKTLKVVGRVSGVISALFLALDVYSIVCDSIEISEINKKENERKAEEFKSETLKFILQMRETAAQFQETLDEIKSARDDINRVTDQLKSV
ncbi:apolipoprotein L3-like isoform X1 [Megalobrama amblycephala]|uniref:apolipoprotein L3-like isoform X1 n=2 Tax=Megalobrama amblycephala TaxID=75352 RepID=UPI002013DAF8|nr:apolipoprotein L3-like isoform X1 [Megalobrama amblycephala]